MHRLSLHCNQLHLTQNIVSGPKQHILAPKSHRRTAISCQAASKHDGDVFIDEFLETEQPQSPTSNVRCFGCGISLQTETIEAAGYVDPEKFATKRRHRQLNQLICSRCQELSNGGMIPGVADFAQRRQQRQQEEKQPPNDATATSTITSINGRILLTPEELRAQLTTLRKRHALVVLLVDLLDASGSILSNVRDLVGANPIVLVGTKADLLPSGTREEDIVAWLQALAEFKRINVVGVHVLSSKSGAGVSQAVGGIRKERKGRDVFVLGAANVGKSAFIRALVKDMSRMSSRQYDPMAAAKGKQLPVESPMPGTTLGTIPLDVFSAGGRLYDTPGLHLHHRIPHMLTPEENKQLHPRKKLKLFVAPSPSELLETLELSPSSATLQDEEEESDGGEEVNPKKNSKLIASYDWGGLARIDVLDAPGDLHLTFCGPPVLRVTSALRDIDDVPLVPLEESKPTTENSGNNDEFGSDSVRARGGLRLAKTLSVPRMGYNECLADIAVSGVPGWVGIYSSMLKAGKRVELRVWAPVGVEVFLRPPVPVPSPFY